MNSNKLPYSQIGLVPKEVVTASQINSLLSVIASLADYLAKPSTDPENPHLGKSKDGGSKIAAENTFMDACNRLDKIIADDSRWSLMLQNLLEVRTLEMLDANLEFLRAQTAASKNLVSPAFQYRPQLIKISDGSWVAILGDYKNLETAVVGVGNSPEAALRDFDQSFNGVITPEAVAWLESQNLYQKTKTSKKKKSE